MFNQPMVENIVHPKVQEFVDRHPPEVQYLLLFLRAEVCRAMPEVREEFKWSVPYYRERKTLAYLNVRKGMVEIGFTHGHRLHDPEGVLQSKELKLIRHLRYDPTQDLDPKPLREFLRQSVELARS